MNFRPYSGYISMRKDIHAMPGFMVFNPPRDSGQRKTMAEKFSGDTWGREEGGIPADFGEYMPGEH